MPIRSHDPFRAFPDHWRESINPYLGRLDGPQKKQNVLLGEQLRHLPGKWRAQFAATKAPDRLILEIGCHKGTTLLKLAEQNPNDAFVGVDITLKRIVMSSERALRKNLNNIRVSLFNAQSLEQVFAADELDGILIFFPDPWPKDKHAKNRILSHPEFSRSLFSRLCPGGFIWLKTDQETYATEAGGCLENAGFSRVMPAESPLGPGDYVSTFESHFRKAGLPIFESVWRRPLN